MNRLEFARQSRSKAEVLSLLNDPQLPAKLLRTLEQYSGSLPSTGIAAGQAVATAIDEHLGLTENLQYNDLDIFRTLATSEDRPLFYTKYLLGLFVGTYLLSGAGHIHPESGPVFSFTPRAVSHLDQSATVSALCGCTRCKNAGSSSGGRLSIQFDQAFVYFVHKVIAEHPSLMEIVHKEHRLQTNKLSVVMRFASKFRYVSISTQDPVFYSAYAQCIATIMSDRARLFSVYGWGFVNKAFRRTLSFQIAEDCWADPTVGEYCSPIASARFDKISTFAEYSIIGIHNDAFTQTVITSPGQFSVSGDSNDDVVHSQLSASYVEADASIASGQIVNNSFRYGLAIVHAFDINGVSVGIDLATERLVYTNAYVEFLMNRQLFAQSASTPMQTAIRLFNKAEKIPAFLDKERTLQGAISQLTYALTAATGGNLHWDIFANSTPENYVEEITRVVTAMKTGKLAKHNAHRVINSVISEKTYELAMEYPQIMERFEFVPYRGSSVLPVPRTVTETTIMAFRPLSETPITPASYPPYAFTMYPELASMAATAKPQVKQRINTLFEVLRLVDGTRNSQLDLLVFNLKTHTLTPFQTYLLDNGTPEELCEYYKHSEWSCNFVGPNLIAAKQCLAAMRKFEKAAVRLNSEEKFMGWLNISIVAPARFGFSSLLLGTNNRQRFAMSHARCYATLANNVFQDFEDISLKFDMHRDRLSRYIVPPRTIRPPENVHDEASYFEWFVSELAIVAEMSCLYDLATANLIHTSPFSRLPIHELIASTLEEWNQKLQALQSNGEALKNRHRIETLEEKITLLRNIRIEELYTRAQLNKESQELDHCVDTYFSSVYVGKCRIYQYQYGEDRATAEWRMQHMSDSTRNLAVWQLYARSNTPPSPKIEKADALIREILCNSDALSLWHDRS